MSLVFLDTETLGLGLDDPIWEIAAIRREDDGTETRYHWHLTDGAGPVSYTHLTLPTNREV